jgi:peptide/nickel transport system ATP-binding protein
VLGSMFGQRLEAIPGVPLDLRLLAEGCSFEPRCRFAEDRCRTAMPPEIALTSERMTRCLRVAAREVDLAPSFNACSAARG